MKNLIYLFLSNKNGNIATLFGFLALPLTIAIGAAIEFGNIANIRQKMQDAADSGAIAAANKLNFLSKNASTAGAEQSGTDTALYQLKDEKQLSKTSFATTIDQHSGTVEVKGQTKVTSLFNILSNKGMNIKVNSVAETLNKTPLCVMHTETGDNEDDDQTFNIRNRASLIADGCLIHSNKYIKGSGEATILASSVQAVKKFVGFSSGSTPGKSGALVIEDPFAGLEIKIDRSCPHGYKDLEVKPKTPKSYSVDPGVHCGDIRIGGDAIINLQPGVHYFIGDFSMRGNSRLYGKNVTLIFANKSFKNQQEELIEEGQEDYIENEEEKNNRIVFGENTNIDLQASNKGPFPGFLIITDRDLKQGFSISSRNVDNLLGTIYVPESPLRIDTGDDVAERSTWTVIVAKSLNIIGQSKLIINKNYGGADVPVPEGVGNNAVKPRLRK